MGVGRPLDPAAVVEFAVEELGHVLGSGFPGRVFLAGGAFKTLLHGRPPRDLDLWAPTEADRSALVAWLRGRGAVDLGARAFSEGFHVSRQEVEVPLRAEPSVLVERLGRFDIGLSAIGVEYDHGRLSAVVHPLAVESVDRREVILLKPLVNWRHCLSTLARARSYAAELGYGLPNGEEAAVWAVFEAQDEEMQRGMIERYRLAAAQGWGVVEEAEGRRRR